MLKKVMTALGLALSDLWSEKVMTICLVLAIAAVVTPLLVLGSLKIGFVDRLRNDLIRDPTFRELYPSDAAVKEKKLFDALANSDAVSFWAPTTMMVPREVIFRKEGQRQRQEARLVPTGPADPLVKRSGKSELAVDEVVISDSLGKAAKLDVGDKIELMVFRSLSDRRERVMTKVQVSGFFPSEFASTPTIVGHPTLDREVEGWRSGQPVPRLNWPGTEVEMKQQYRQVHLATAAPLSQFALDALETRLGISEIRPSSWSDYLNDVAIDPNLISAPGFGADATHYRLIRQSNRFSFKDVEAIAEIVDETKQIASGIGGPIEFKVGDQKGVLSFVDFRLFGKFCEPHCLNSRSFALSLDRVPVFGPEHLDLSKVYLSPFDQPVRLSTRPKPVLNGSGNTLADWRLGGMLYRASAMNMRYDNDKNRFYESSSGYRGFRAVARDLDSVVVAADLIKAAGYTVRSSEAAVRRLQKLDGGLNILVAVVAGVALVGGFVVLGINFFASVQRKRMSFAILRLLGMRKLLVFLHPFFQSIVIVLAGYVLSVIAYHAVSFYVNLRIAEGLGFGGTLSVLRLEHFLGVFVVVVLGSVLACLISAVHATRVDASIALKDVAG